MVSSPLGSAAGLGLLLMALGATAQDKGELTFTARPVNQTEQVGRSCCYGREWFEHGAVVASFPEVCLQLMCRYGRIVQVFFNKPGDTGCCQLGTQMYPSGGELPGHCVNLRCKGGRWYTTPVIDECCGHCAVYGDPHVKTFDDQHYDWHGTCNYSLTQTDRTYEPKTGVFSDFVPCRRASCPRYTTFRDDPNTVVTLDSTYLFNVRVNGNPVYVPSSGVVQLQAGGVAYPVLAFRQHTCIWLVGASRITVRHCRMRVDIYAHPLHTDQLDGLCGHFNKYRQDDFTTRSGQVQPLVPLPVAFPLSWKTNVQMEKDCYSSCPESNVCSSLSTLKQPDGGEAPDPCQARANEAKEWKMYMEICHKRLYELVNGTEELESYYESCAVDLCVVSEGEGSQEEVDQWLSDVWQLTCEARQAHDASNGITSVRSCYLFNFNSRLAIKKSKQTEQRPL